MSLPGMCVCKYESIEYWEWARLIVLSLNELGIGGDMGRNRK